MQRRTLLLATASTPITALLLMGMANPAETAPLTDTIPPEKLPAVVGGKLQGEVSQTITVSGEGEVTVSFNRDTGDIKEKHPDGRVKEIKGTDFLKNLKQTIENAPEDKRKQLAKFLQSPTAASSLQQSFSTEVPAVSKEQICPYVVGLIGYGHGALWQHALSMTAINPAFAFALGLGEAAFWIWVSTHC